jgi:hypothetical protein
MMALVNLISNNCLKKLAKNKYNKKNTMFYEDNIIAYVIFRWSSIPGRIGESTTNYANHASHENKIK